MLLGELQLNHHVLPDSRIQQTTNVFERMRGLLGRAELMPRESLWITHCNSIHTFFMRYSIDVVFINKQGFVLKIGHHVAPWRVLLCIAAKSALELRAGDAEKLGLAVGAQLKFLPKE